ncbi:MAG: hypothetical protein CSYNP_03998 [Syntrophus sp. SKADARSKE-3]|nr:hypothetical protein [Syntrophus sp. SKADARSKE-3]
MDEIKSNSHETADEANTGALLNNAIPGQAQASLPVSEQLASAAKMKGLFDLKSVAMLLVMCAAVSAASLFVYDKYFATKIVAIDIRGFIADQRDLIMQGKIDSEQLKKNLDLIDVAISKVKPNEIAIMGDTIIKNGRSIEINSRSQRPATSP